jgi:hypothetical protein
VLIEFSFMLLCPCVMISLLLLLKADKKRGVSTVQSQFFSTHSVTFENVFKVQNDKTSYRPAALTVTNKKYFSGFKRVYPLKHPVEVQKATKGFPVHLKRTSIWRQRAYPPFVGIIPSFLHYLR